MRNLYYFDVYIVQQDHAVSKIHMLLYLLSFY